ncbi:MAG TPA: hypothetical protein VI461_03070 [Chitinophagaceae bacterium]|nr:hypothetical protein [Chitinophagaceae bacterium]
MIKISQPVRKEDSINNDPVLYNGAGFEELTLYSSGKHSHNKTYVAALTKTFTQSFQMAQFSLFI